MVVAGKPSTGLLVMLIGSKIDRPKKQQTIHSRIIAFWNVRYNMASWPHFSARSVRPIFSMGHTQPRNRSGSGGIEDPTMVIEA